MGAPQGIQQKNIVGDWVLVSKRNTLRIKRERRQSEEGEYKENTDRIDKINKCEIERQIVKITKITQKITKITHKPVKNSISTCSEVNSIQVKVLNPLDSDVTLEVGDDIASVKIEKDVNSHSWK